MNNPVSFPFFGILGLILITLKLVGTITWPWWWVLSPFWIPFIMFISVVVFIALMFK